MTVDNILTIRQKEIIACMSCGYSRPQIADKLNISFTRVKNHINHIYRKFGAKNRNDVLAIYKKVSTGAPTDFITYKCKYFKCLDPENHLPKQYSDEIFKQHPLHKAVYISNYGRAWQYRKGSTEIGYFASSGANSVNYDLLADIRYNNGNLVNRQLAYLVAETFLPNPNKFKFVSFKDGIKINVKSSNLEWTKKYQQSFFCDDQKENDWYPGKKIKPNNCRPVYQICSKTGKKINEHPSIRDAYHSLGREKNSDLKRVLTGIKVSAYGYLWRFKEDADLTRKELKRKYHSPLPI